MWGGGVRLFFCGCLRHGRGSLWALSSGVNRLLSVLAMTLIIVGCLLLKDRSNEVLELSLPLAVRRTNVTASSAYVIHNTSTSSHAHSDASTLTHDDITPTPRQPKEEQTEHGNVDTGTSNSLTSTNHFLRGCSSTPPNLKGKLEVEENVNVSEAEARVGGSVRWGGFSWPSECEARWSVAIIVPYRDRPHQVGPFLNHMHPFLQRQQLNYSIYFIEQAGTDLFNRARLLNVGFLESHKEGPWDCYVFHDVDLLPENDYHLYHCSAQPRHLAVARSNDKYRSSLSVPYDRYFGGACLMKEGHIRRVNGWSNVYWGWGGEDDDMWRRIVFTDMAIWRYPAPYARYRMIKHKKQEINGDRYKIVNRNTGRFPRDGLSNLNYTVKRMTRHALYTHILADIGYSTDSISNIPDVSATTFLKKPKKTS